MKNMFKLYSLIPLVFLLNTRVFAWEVYDRVIATVNETPIIESEVNRMNERSQIDKKIPAKNVPETKSRILDSFIADSLVAQTADRESIIVSNEKVDDQIQKIMKSMNLKSAEEFQKYIEKTEKVSYDDFRDDLRKNMIRELVMLIAIGITPPSQKEAEDYYTEHKKEWSYELDIQHIMIKLNNETFEENKRVSKIIKEVYDKLVKKQSTFENLAREFSEDAASKNKAGKLGWVAIPNIAKDDLIYANNLYREFIDNQDRKEYAIVKSNAGYHIVKVSGRRPTSFEAVSDYIYNVLRFKKMNEQFKKWVSNRRMESEIKIYMEDYITEKNTENT